MTPEERSLLERTLSLTQENNTLLRKIRNSARISSIMRLFYWLIILGLSFGSYYFIQPYLDQLRQIYSGVNDGINTVKSAQSQFADIPEILKSIGR